MEIRVEQPCPQCGGAVTLSAADRLLACPYCRVKNFLLTGGGPFRYVLPNRARDQARLIYAPYLRFKGNIFSVAETGVSHRIIDTTQEGCGLPGLPASLGLRPQAMSLSRVSSETKGRFLPMAIEPRKVFEKATKLHNLIEGNDGGEVYHHAFIGETVSFIYLPLLAREDGLFDAVLGQPLMTSSGAMGGQPFQPHWQMKFLAALCPRCGGNLDGEGDCVVATCANCDSAWQIGGEGLERIACKILPVSKDQAEPAMHLPFWKIQVKLPSLQIGTFADFVERTNQPLAVRPEWRRMAMQFWIPAFKLRPEIFLRTGRQITVSQRQFGPERDMRMKAAVSPHPVTLPLSEARQSIKVMLAFAAANGRAVYSKLPGAEPEVLAASLVFLPFSDRQHDWVQSHSGVSVNKSILQFGRNL
ncbi:MAG: hypothetical protein ACTFAK_01930 [Candidatus Electronema sp. VV]